MRGSKKVENGKLVKVDVEYDDVLEDVKIHGDFFVEPPKRLKEIEEKIEGLKPEREKLIDNVQEIDARLIGFSEKDLVDAIMEAVK